MFENNLVARSDNYCMQVGGDGEGDDGNIRGLLMRNNTGLGLPFRGHPLQHRVAGTGPSRTTSSRACTPARLPGPSARRDTI